MAAHWQPGGGLDSILAAMNAALAAPLALRWTEHSARFLLLFTLTYAVAAVVLVSDKCNTRPGAEHGSACWGDVSALNRKYRDKHGTNLLLTKHFQIGVDGYKHKHNTNVLVIGGSGAGKTRTYAVPNVLQAGCSMVITDPKAEILRKTGAFLLAQGYEVRVFDLIDRPPRSATTRSAMCRAIRTFCSLLLTSSRTPRRRTRMKTTRSGRRPKPLCCRHLCST